MEAISTITLFPENKEQNKIYLEKIKDSFLSGEFDKLKIYKLVKNAIQVLTDFCKIKEVKEEILIEAEKFGEKTFNHSQAKFQIKEAGVKYDYSLCNDNEILTLYSEQEALKKKIKEREDFLKNISGEVYNSEGVMLQKPSKISETIVSVEIS